ncbi:SMC-Scp complex subunit ScpB [Thalassobacillus pellis]|uniref:SMC-Scp complex subunit ScpB n=1 Tax=Thalassobacillus pellis TaxID=748008 RepID=UPI001960DF61|nr:SMC-Scp complex subunit ScpB [Thalassobacillus pellis]MBM7552411.1 segregation and condensation protein B [Thalassobacillus pellis]
MNKKYQGIVEGLLFVVGEEGITRSKLAELAELEASELEEILKDLQEDYKHEGRGITLMESGKTLYLSSKPQHSVYLKRLLESPQTPKLSQAALETLAIIAYQQPITRVEVEELRGVKSDRAIHTLVVRSMIEEVGRREGIGRPILYGTTTDFLTYFGITSLDELPPLPEGTEEDLEQEADLFFENIHTKEDNEKHSQEG